LHVIENILPIFIFLIMGYSIRIKKIVSETTIEELKKFIIHFPLPSLLFIAFLDMQIKAEYWMIVLTIFLVNLVMLFLGKTLYPYFGIEDPYCPLLFTGFEVGMLGIPLFGAIYGLDNIKYFALLDLGQELYVWFVLMAILYYLNQKTANYCWLIKRFFSSPIIIAIIAGLFINVAGLKVIIVKNFFLKGFLETLGLLSNVTIPLILIIIGYEMKLSLNSFIVPLKIIALRTIFLLFIAVIISRFLFHSQLKLDPIYHVALYSLFILPPPFVIPLFIPKERIQPYVLNTLSLGTVITIIIFTIISVYFQTIL